MKPGSCTGIFASEWRNCWLYFGIALGLLLWIDLATTLAAAHFYGVGAEANPIMRMLLERGIGVVVLIHLVIFVIAVIGFHLIVLSGQRLDPVRQMRFRNICVGWIGLLIVAGIFVVANNLALVLFAIGG